MPADGESAAPGSTANERADTRSEGASNGGTYTLLCQLDATVEIDVGALGARTFAAGWYAYTGSAFGPGGFARVERHREVATGERGTRHWHIDYLLGQPAATLQTVVRTSGLDAECAVSRAIDGDPIPGFGASDCACETHLVSAPRPAELARSIERAHER